MTLYPSAGSGQVLGAVDVLIIGTTQLTTSYYAFGGAMVAMRTAATATLTYLHSDHLGSVSLPTNASEGASCVGAAARACRLTLRRTGLPVRSGQASRSPFDFAQNSP